VHVNCQVDGRTYIRAHCRIVHNLAADKATGLRKGRVKSVNLAACVHERARSSTTRGSCSACLTHCFRPSTTSPQEHTGVLDPIKKRKKKGSYYVPRPSRNPKQTTRLASNRCSSFESRSVQKTCIDHALVIYPTHPQKCAYKVRLASLVAGLSPTSFDQVQEERDWKPQLIQRNTPGYLIGIGVYREFGVLRNIDVLRCSTSSSLIESSLRLRQTLRLRPLARQAFEKHR
jgi:hypothetical protein